jgi:hypothetical protein
MQVGGGDEERIGEERGGILRGVKVARQDGRFATVV